MKIEEMNTINADGTAFAGHTLISKYAPVFFVLCLLFLVTL